MLPQLRCRAVRRKRDDATTCSNIQANYRDEEFRVLFQSAMMGVRRPFEGRGSEQLILVLQPNWEACQRQGEYCTLDPTNATASQINSASATCEQGSVSPYFVRPGLLL